MVLYDNILEEKSAALFLKED